GVLPRELENAFENRLEGRGRARVCAPLGIRSGLAVRGAVGLRGAHEVAIPRVRGGLRPTVARPPKASCRRPQLASPRTAGTSSTRAATLSGAPRVEITAIEDAAVRLAYEPQWRAAELRGCIDDAGSRADVPRDANGRGIFHE